MSTSARVSFGPGSDVSRGGALPFRPAVSAANVTSVLPGPTSRNSGDATRALITVRTASANRTVRRICALQ